MSIKHPLPNGTKITFEYDEFDQNLEVPECRFTGRAKILKVEKFDDYDDSDYYYFVLVIDSDDETFTPGKTVYISFSVVKSVIKD